jgi:hypothetical protein
MIKFSNVAAGSSYKLEPAQDEIDDSKNLFL